VILVDLVGVGAARPGRALFDNLSLTLNSRDRLGIVGINGTGKSTLLRVISGEDAPETGTVRCGRGVRVSMLNQAPTLDDRTVSQAAGGSWESDAILDRLGMGAALDKAVSTLSGGQAKRVALARALAEPSDLLILDEPTNHLDIDAIAWLEDRLDDYQGGLVLVTHDRHVLDRITNRVLELDRGAAYLHEGGYQAYLDARALREEQAESAERVRKNLAKRELAWLRRGAPARTSKPKARIATATELINTKAQAAARTGDLPLHFGTPRLGDRVIELHGVGHRWATPAGAGTTDAGTTEAAGSEDWLFRGVELLLDPRERLGVVGPNGIGKSTLLEIMSGRLTPAEGSVETGSTAQIGVFDQHGRTLDPTMRVRDAVAGPHRVPDHTDSALMEAFWFDGDAQWAPIGLLSGGERRRLQLLVTLAAKPNVLLLDEPTNDLDLDTLRALEDFLDEWPGALIVVSHDRAFLERTVADVVVFDGAGEVRRRPGGYSAYETERRAAHRRKGSVAKLESSKESLSTSASAAEGAQPAAGAAAASNAKGAAGAGSSNAKLVSPSTLRHRFRAVERRQAELHTRHEQLATEMSQAASDHERLAALAVEFAEVGAELEAVETEWLDLASEAEARSIDLGH
jgi:ATP-binding cassette subfamily F protein uup